jgi:cytochrome c oxidase subunit II
MAETHGAQSTPHRPPVNRQTVLRLLAMGVVAAAIGIVIGLEIPWFPPAAAKQAHTIDTMYYVLIFATVPIFVLVSTVVIYSGLRWRMRPGEERLDGPPIHGNTHLEVLWTALPSVLIASLVVYAAIVLNDIGVKKPNTLKIGVIGQQWEWRFVYPAYHDAAGKPIVTYQLYLPNNRPVVFEISSVDVIHTLYIPAFRLQEDAVPGLTTSFRASPDRLGSYPLICNQLCGYGHSTMRTTLHIITPASFNTFLAEHGYSAPAQTSSSVHGTSTRGARRTEVADAASSRRSGQTNPKEGTQ